MARIQVKGKISTEEFNQRLAEARRSGSVIDDLRGLIEDMVRYELRYDMSTEEFYDKFMRGEMGDDMDFIRWAGRYETYCRIRDKVEAGIEKAMT